MSRIVLVPLFLVLAAAAVLAPAAGAADPESIALPFEPRAIDYDPTTELFVVDASGTTYVNECSTRRVLVVVNRAGAEQWRAVDPVPCSWLVTDGEIYIGTANTVRRHDLQTGAVIREWTLPNDVRATDMTLAGGQLWFNHPLRGGTQRGVGSLDPDSDATPAISLYSNTKLLEISPDGSVVYLGTGSSVTRIDRTDPNGPGGTVSVPGLQWDWPPLVQLSADGDHLYGLSDQVELRDATTLQLLDQGTPASHPNRFERLPDGRIVTTANGRNRPVTVFGPDSADPIGAGPLIESYDTVDVRLAGDEIAVAIRTPGAYRIELHPITPELIQIDSAPIDANNPRSVSMELQWVTAVETITINGQNVLFDQTPGNENWLQVHLPALPQGTHRIVFDGPLGPSRDVAANYLVVGPAQRRADLEILIRDDSAASDIESRVNCHPPQSGLPDVYDRRILRPGDRLMLRPVVGHECTVQFSRQDSGGVHANDWAHYTLGYFDPATDPEARNMLDIERWAVTFGMPSAGEAVAAYMPEFDRTVLWTYSHGFGSVPVGERSPITIDCPVGGEIRDTYFGYWVRSEISRNSACSLHHGVPDGTEFSGFGSYDRNSQRIQQVTPGPTLELPAGEAVHVVAVYDVYPHPSEHNGAFVSQQYRDFLGREGEPAGVANWTAALDRGVRSRTALVSEFIASPEFGGTAAPVNRLYRAYFDRAPDRSGLLFWMNWIRGGRTLIEVSNEFARSPEFERTYGSLDDAAFVDLVYENVLGRAPDSDGRTFWVTQMQAGLTRGELMVNFSESIEYVELTAAEVTVESLYQGLLQRSPDPQGFAYWTGVVESGAPLDHLIAGMLGSDEYYSRFDNIIDDLPLSGSSRIAGLRPSTRAGHNVVAEVN